MPQQPSSASFLISSAGKAPFAVALPHRRPHFILHELADGIASQFLVVVERKIHRVRCTSSTSDANTRKQAGLAEFR